uniref:Reverse transcriptase domain-containing protein n=1 Tax=Micrurus lemniscatus lemniscatus TaxID=129467 RepID=A0A2D4HTI4_MICLE
MFLSWICCSRIFDNLIWEFMKYQINLMKFGDNFTQMLESIYSNQKARVMINEEFTNPFKIKKGVRQGCPLSPLLFITILETLLDRIRMNEEIKGTKIKRQEHKL